jgi:hypothetical protein
MADTFPAFVTGNWFDVVTGLPLKGLSHETLRPVFGTVWIYLGLNGNHFSFLNFKEGSLILDSYFRY